MSNDLAPTSNFPVLDFVPAEPQPPPPAHHSSASAESFDCAYGAVSGDPPRWLPCDCEDPANPWPPRAANDGPIDCQCSVCCGKQPRHMRGRLVGCEYRDHHCEFCHEQKICTVIACGFDRNIDVRCRSVEE